MKLLIDTNIFIPLEPASAAYISPLTEGAASLLKFALDSDFQLYTHPVALEDLKRDQNPERKRLRILLLSKYPPLPDPPPISSEIKTQLGDPGPESHDWVDHHLLTALAVDAVDLLITEDRRIHGKAKRLGLNDRVFTLSEATTWIQHLVDRIPGTPPAIRTAKAHTLDPRDPILHSLRSEYSDFDPWFQKCRREHRQAWIIDSPDGSLAGLCLVKHEKAPPPGMTGRVLKLSLFKVSEAFNGFRFGELLLKAVFEYAWSNRYDWLFITVFEKHAPLIDLLQEFGFTTSPIRSGLGELVLSKPLNPPAQGLDSLDPLEFHIRYGPRLFRTDVASYIIHILPRYAGAFFPESASQTGLYPGATAFGNAIRKAYLSNSRIRSVPKGALLLFYQSRINRGVIALGVSEGFFRSSSPNVILRVVAKRTVYTLEDITTLCARSTLIILFRQARIFWPPLLLKDLQRHNVIGSAPQSITRVKEEGIEWLKTAIAV